MELTARKKEILKVVTERYIDTADPVSSKFIAQAMGGGLSSATIRNELADLVELGYLEQPHTSAGRVPSPQGLPAVRQRADGAPRRLRSGGRRHQSGPGGPDAGAGQRHRPV